MSPELWTPVPAFVVLRGQAAGQRIPVREGAQRVGREAASGIVLDEDGVSRRHAVVIRDPGGVRLQDAGSTNGTWVNGARLVGVHELAAGDEVVLGSVALRFEDGTAAADETGVMPPVSAERPAPAPVAQAPSAPVATPAPATGGSKVSLGRLVLVAGLISLVTLAVGVAIQFLTDRTGTGVWLAAPLTAMAGVLIEAVRESLSRKRGAQAPPPAAPPATAPPAGTTPPPTTASSAPPGTGMPPVAAAPPPAPRPSRSGPATALLVLVVLVAVGAVVAGITYGVAKVSGYFSGNQPGVDRLAGGAVEESAAGVVVTVDEVEETADFTRVGVTVSNGLTESITIPLYRSATLSAAGGATLEADSFRSTWNDTIAPGQVQSGTIVFPGGLPAGTVTASLAFAQIYSFDFDAPSSIVVDGIELGDVEDQAAAAAAAAAMARGG